MYEEREGFRNQFYNYDNSVATYFDSFENNHHFKSSDRNGDRLRLKVHERESIIITEVLFQDACPFKIR